MRKIILNLAVSLDGFIEGPNGEYDWCLTDQDYGMTEFYQDTDAIFIGRKSYDLIAAEEHPFPGSKVYVFSDTLPAVDNGELQVIRSADFDSTVEEIISAEGKNIYLFGGADLLSAFINKNLVAEMLLSVHPVMLGAGKPLFQNIHDKVELNLLTQQTYSTGLVQLRYSIQPRFDMEMLKLL